MIPNPLHHLYGAALLSYCLFCPTVCPFILSNRWILSHPPHQGYWLGCTRLLKRGGSLQTELRVSSPFQSPSVNTPERDYHTHPWVLQRLNRDLKRSRCLAHRSPTGYPQQITPCDSQIAIMTKIGELRYEVWLLNPRP